MDLKMGFICLVGFVILQRLYELRISRRNEKLMILKGGVLAPNKDMPIMIVLHSTWLTYCTFLAIYVPVSRIQSDVFLGFVTLFFIGQILRVVAIKTLKERWCVKVISIPNFKPVNTGIFKVIKHPNYLGVIIEIFALPLIVGDVVGAIFFSVLNGALLFYRVRSEEKFLQQHTNYHDEMLTKSKFIPKVL